ncbi:MAG TPA: phenylalanine--tRNA ligase subunit beta [Solirubrobacteraceae bacterium]|jgi:phenylalanyl-tRNA synthetase beta chain
MRVPLNWIREYCDPPLDTAAIEERLTMTGTKVEAILHHGVPSAENFVVGRVLVAEKHPDADKLKACKVDVGDAAPADIVCGAPNVAAGQTVAVALPGAVMPGGMKIKAAKLRGLPSNGMILSEQELEVGAGSEGIMVLDGLTVDAELAPGTPLAEVLAISSDVFQLEVTPNRPDCLGVYGVARELHAATGAPIAPEPWGEDPGTDGPVAGAEVHVECTDLCRRFTARAFADVEIAPSPPWLKARLMASGQRPINNVVDITNYVMLLTGQPMHAFDLDRVAGARLTVRRAHKDEQITTLDGQVRTLDEEMVLIEDADGPTSIAGVMGGERSEVEPSTKRVLMEVANWNGPNIHRTSWSLGLRSEASARFEKDLAPEQCSHAQAVATRLMIELCKARLMPGTIDIADPTVSSPPIHLRERRVQAILGMPVPLERQAAILGALGFGVAHAADGLEVSVPPERRNDVSREADLIEEVARIHGLEALPATLPARRGAYGRLSPRQQARRRAVDALVGRGLFEVFGWTFTAPTLFERLRLPDDDPRRDAPALENPLSEDHALLRTTLLGSLLDAASRNVAHGIADLRLFELGTIFSLAASRPTGEAALSDTGVHEHQALGVLLSGRVTPVTWGSPSPPRADLFAVKGVLEALADALHIPLECQTGSQPFLHPARAATVTSAGRDVGWLGELHPLIARDWGLDGAAVMEITLDQLLVEVPMRTYRDVISFPALRQDLAVVLPAGVPAGDVLTVVRSSASALLDDVRVFDVYTGAQIGEGKRSLALALSFRSPERTLTDEDVAPVRQRIVAALSELGGELRG